MGGHYRDADIIAQIRTMQEQIRRLQTRTFNAHANAPEEWRSLLPYLNNNGTDTGWFSSSIDPTTFDFARFYRHAGRVYFAGLVEFSMGSGPASDPLIMVNAPAGYEPERLQNVPILADPDNSDGTIGDQVWWMGEFLPGTPDWYILDQHPELYLGSPNFGWPPESTVLALETLSYRHE